MTQTSPDPPTQPTLNPWLRAALSVLIVLHVLAVFIPPFALPGSELGRVAVMRIRPYVEPAALDNGYRFFAPNPGPSHLVRYEIELPDGETLKGKFPDIKKHRPRLLYHRHFMLSEFLNNLLYDDPDQAPEPPAEAYIRSYARHLARKHKARQVTLYLVLHKIPTPQETLRGVHLTDRSLFDERKLGTFDSEGRRL